jgi:hypothetical protein
VMRLPLSVQIPVFRFGLPARSMPTTITKVSQPF